MKVKAVRIGYYDLKRRHPGEVFEIKDSREFSDSKRRTTDKIGPGWMEEWNDDESSENSPSKRQSKSKVSYSQEAI